MPTCGRIRPELDNLTKPRINRNELLEMQTAPDVLPERAVYQMQQIKRQHDRIGENQLMNKPDLITQACVWAYPQGVTASVASKKYPEFVAYVQRVAAN
jgi:hypothetical protein